MFSTIIIYILKNLSSPPGKFWELSSGIFTQSPNLEQYGLFEERWPAVIKLCRLSILLD